MKVKFEFNDEDKFEVMKMKRMLQADNCFSLLWALSKGQIDLDNLEYEDNEELKLSEEELEYLKNLISSIITELSLDYRIDLELYS